MAKILNIDAFQKEERVLEIGGKSYEIKDVSVGLFMDMAKNEGLVDDNDYLKQFEMMTRFLGATVPTLPIEVINSLTPNQLGIVVAFVRGDYDVEAAEQQQQLETEKKTQSAKVK